MSQLTDELAFLPQDSRFFINAFHDLSIEYADEIVENIHVERAFPLNAPNQFIVVKNEEGDEIGILEHIKHLDSDSQETLLQALEQSYFLPQITKIYSVESNFHIPKWSVETDRGPREFEIPSSRRDVRVVGDGRVLLRDADGNRYEISNYRKLDPDSLAFVETLI